MPTSLFDAEKRFSDIWDQERERWNRNDVSPVDLNLSVFSTADYCLSTIARVQIQDFPHVAKITEIHAKMRQKFPTQFIYPLDTIHVSLQGCTQRHRTREALSLERIQKIDKLCSQVIKNEQPVEIHLTGLNILGPQVFVQGLPTSQQWARLRERLDATLRDHGEEPMTYRDKNPMHLNIMRISDPDPQTIAEVLDFIKSHRSHDLGALTITKIEFVLTDFLFSVANREILNTYHLG
jgi:2'-5' RNA ligase